MYTVTSLYRSEYRIKGSKFSGYLQQINSKGEADLYLDKIREEHPAATHHCYAWRVHPNRIEEFEQDDGEPKGTAGRPIMNALKSANLVNCIIVSVRYFGGTKLGKSGLIHAYGRSADLCIEEAGLKEIIPIRKYKIVYRYEHQGIIDKFKNDYPLIELNADYLEHVDFEFGCPLSKTDRLDGNLQPFEHLFLEFEKMEASYHVKK